MLCLASKVIGSRAEAVFFKNIENNTLHLFCLKRIAGAKEEEVVMLIQQVTGLGNELSTDTIHDLYHSCGANGRMPTKNINLGSWTRRTTMISNGVLGLSSFVLGLAVGLQENQSREE